MSPAVDECERLILAGDLRHGMNPVLRWHCSNTALTVDPSGNRKFDKRKSRSRIDGVVSLAMAVCLAARYRQEKQLAPTIAWL